MRQIVAQSKMISCLVSLCHAEHTDPSKKSAQYDGSEEVRDDGIVSG